MTEISIEIECSQFTEGRYWAGDFWVTLATALVPESLDTSNLEGCPAPQELKKVKSK